MSDIIKRLSNSQTIFSSFFFCFCSSLNNRFYTTLQKDVIKYDLGRAVCGNFFYATWDNTVDRNLGLVRGPFPGFFTRQLSNLGLLAQFNAAVGLRSADGIS